MNRMVSMIIIKLRSGWLNLLLVQLANQRFVMRLARSLTVLSYIILGKIILLMSSPAELFSCVDAQVILNSPINDSTAKNHWSFAKDGRFKRPKFYCDSFYNIPGVAQNKNRKAGIGIGKKTDLDVGKHPHNVSPSPDTYDIPTFVQTNEAHHKGFSPLYSRQEIAPMSYIELEPKKVPGPGTYEQLRRNDSAKWSMRPRVTSDLFPKTTALIVPAPCTYQNTQAICKNLTGKYHLSKHRNSKAKVFNPPRSRRFYKSTTDAPGPGIYTPRNDISAEGKYVLSRHVSAGKRTFMDGRRTSFTDLKAKGSFAPGPGSYRTPSDFGYYDSAKERAVRLSKSQMMSRSKNIDASAQTSATNPK